MIKTQLAKELGLRDSLAIVIGSMIGTGIFLKTAGMTALLGSSMWVLAAWLVAGILSVLGAMTFAELGVLFPRAGGGYVYIKEAYGRLPAFLAGWVSFWVILPGSIAAYAIACAIFLCAVFPLQEVQGPVACALIFIFTVLNSFSIVFGGFIQTLMTALKAVLILGLVGAIFLLTPTPVGLVQVSQELVPSGHFGWGAFGLAVLSALWAFDGWESVSRVAGEMKQPSSTLPKALVIGTGTVFLLYALLNLSYFWALPLNQIAQAHSTEFPLALPVATQAVMGFLGQRGVEVLSIIFVISTLGAMNGSILTSARVPYAMASDGLFFKSLAKVHRKSKVPVRAVWVQSAVSMALALSGTFDQLTNYVVFSAWIFYGFTGFAVFLFRKRLPNADRPYRVPGYPWTPAIFVLMSAVLVVTTIVQSPQESLIGALLILLGLPFYFLINQGEIETRSSH